MKLTAEMIDENTMTLKEVIEYLDVKHPRVYALEKAGKITKLKGGGFFLPSVEAYKAARNRKGGRPPKQN